MTNYTIKEIELLLQEVDTLDDVRLAALKEDPRKGVQKLLQRHYKQAEKKALLYQDFRNKLRYEENIWKTETVQYIAGIDEVGRGPLAGPVVAASVILPKNPQKLVGVNDSKTLSKEKREYFAELIKEEAIAYLIIEMDNHYIDKYNIFKAIQDAMLKSAMGLAIKPQHLLIDAMKLRTQVPQTSIIKGDLNSLSIAAASIVAKVYRDQLMTQYHELYPEFEFATNMGYGTKSHLIALKEFGYTPIHRKTFAPISTMIKKYQ